AVGRRIPCLRLDSHPPAKTLGRLRARPRGCVRYCDRARQIDLRIFGLVFELSADHACILAHFPEEAQHDVWSRDKAACIATSAAPTGKVSLAPGGYILDGAWSWCSGLRHSQWIMIGGLVFREGEDHPDMRLFLVPV